MRRITGNMGRLRVRYRVARRPENAGAGTSGQNSADVATSLRPLSAILQAIIARIILPLFSLFGLDALSYRLKDSATRFVITDSTGYEKLCQIAQHCPDIEHVITDSPLMSITVRVIFRTAIISGNFL